MDSLFKWRLVNQIECNHISNLLLEAEQFNFFCFCHILHLFFYIWYEADQMTMVVLGRTQCANAWMWRWGSLKKKKHEAPTPKKTASSPHLAFRYIPSPSLFLISISFSLRLRSQIGCLSPRGETARAESPSVSQPRHPSTLHPCSPPHPLSLPGILVCHHLSDASLPPSHQLCLCPTVKWNFESTSNVWKD